MNRILGLSMLVLAGCEGALSGPRPEAVKPPTPGRLTCDTRAPSINPVRRITSEEYGRIVRALFAGQVTPSPYFPTRIGSSVTGYSTEAALNEVGEQGVLQLQRAAEAVAVDVSQVLPSLLPCAAAAADQACLDTWLDTVVRRAFRRSLTAEERAVLQTTFNDMRASGGDFADGIAQVTSAVLQSPQFLYVVEDAAGTGRQLNDVELASRLSFTLWGQGPDDELLNLAEQGTLHDPATLRSQAERLLADSRADVAIVRYFREWTETRSLLSSDKDRTVFPFFDQAYANALDESFNRFVVDQVRNGGTLQSLLTSTDAWVNDALAPSYGVAAPGGWAKVQVDGGRYAGLMTHPLLLSGHAHTTESSFVFRGRLVQKRLLCTPMGDPPANALALFASVQLPEHPTGREVGDAINASPACAGCHRVLNPPGLALEHFDAVGRWRDQYSSGREITTPGTLEGIASPFGFSTPVDLAASLAQRPEATNCLSTQLFRFTFSRLDQPADACAIQSMGDAITASNGSLSEAMLAVVTTDAFSWRADP